jgi:cation transport ATPase
VGIAGTEVAKEAADIVIMDDNFQVGVDSVSDPTGASLRCASLWFAR